MSASQNPQSEQSIDPSQAEAARRQIDQIANEIAQLSESELSPADYYRELLNRVLFAAQAPAAAVWLKTPQGNLLLQFQVNLHEVGFNRSPEARPMHDELLRQAALEGRPSVNQPRSSRSGASPELVAGNPTDLIIMLVPILFDKQVVGLLELFLDPRRHSQALRGLLNFAVRMASYASTYTRNQQLRTISGQQQLWVQLEAFTRQINSSLNPTEVAYQVVNEGRRLVECDRISAAVRMGGKPSVLAISGADVVEKRSNLVVLMRALFDRVLAWGEKLVYTGAQDDSLPPDVLKALDEYLAESNSKVLILLPLKDDREEAAQKKPRSGLLMECFETNLPPEQLLSRLEVIAKHSTPALYNASEYRRIPFRFIWLPLAALQDGLGGRTKAIVYASMAGVLALVLAMILVPYPLRMEAKGQLLPRDRLYVFSPMQGQVLDIIPQNLEAKSVVKKGQELFRMYDHDLAKQMSALNLEIANAQASINNPIPGVGGPGDREAAAKIEEAKTVKRAKIEERNKLVERTGAIINAPGHFIIKAPMDGIVLTSEFRELINKFVRPSDPLLRIGKTDANRPQLNDWEIELKIPQKHVGQVLRAFPANAPETQLDVDILVTSAPTQVFRGKLEKKKVAAQANPNKDDQGEPEPVVMSWVRLVGEDIPPGSRIPTDLLLTGTEVHTRVRCGLRPMGYSLFYGVWEFVFDKIIFYLLP